MLASHQLWQQRVRAFAGATIFQAVLLTSFAAGADFKLLPPPKPVDATGDLVPKLEEARLYIHHKQAVEKYKVTGKGLTVAVIDTGVFAEHQDFAGRVSVAMDFTGGNNPKDEHGHGTHVAGIVAASGVNKGIAPECHIASLKVFGSSGEGSLDNITVALNWVVSNHAEYRISVVNMSLGTESNLSEFTETSDPFFKAIEQLKLRNICVVVAAGNEYGIYQKAGMSYPAIIPDTISVGAIYDRDVGPQSYGGLKATNAFITNPGQVTPFSQRLIGATGDNAGRYSTDVFAPGAPIVSTGISKPDAKSSMNGTSQATPITSGVIVMAQQHYLEKTGKLPTVNQVEEWIRNSSLTANDEDPGGKLDDVVNTNGEYRILDALALLDEIAKSR